MARNFLSDYSFADYQLKRLMGDGCISEPITFNEKIQWIKLYDRNPIYTKLSDKLLVRDYISKKIGSDYLNELLCVFDDADQIDFEKLPNQFILKCNHGSGYNLIIPDKKKISHVDVRAIFKKWQKINYYDIGREWCYKDINRKIVCEKLLADESGGAPLDYKFFCFNGEPIFIQVDLDRFDNHTRLFFDTSWNKQDFELHYKGTTKTIDPPIYLSTMVNLARKLASDFAFVRVDFYALPAIVFGELTFYPGNGSEEFRPFEWDIKLGQLLNLPIKK